MLGLQVTNLTGQILNDFDVMFNKNPFAVYISGQANKFILPVQGQTSATELVCTIDKKNADAKNPPKFPF